MRKKGKLLVVTVSALLSSLSQQNAFLIKENVGKKTDIIVQRMMVAYCFPSQADIDPQSSWVVV